MNKPKETKIYPLIERKKPTIIEEITGRVVNMQPYDNGYGRAKMEAEANTKLYDWEQVEDIFVIDNEDIPYWYGRHKKSGAHVILMRHSRSPELWRVYREGRDAVAKRGVRYTKLPNKKGA